MIFLQKWVFQWTGTIKLREYSISSNNKKSRILLHQDTGRAGGITSTVSAICKSIVRG